MGRSVFCWELTVVGGFGSGTKCSLRSLHSCESLERTGGAEASVVGTRSVTLRFELPHRERFFARHVVGTGTQAKSQHQGYAQSAQD
jgi:hypothetical protein